MHASQNDVFLHEDACATESVAKLRSNFDRLQTCSKVVRSSENEMDHRIEHEDGKHELKKQ